MSAFFRVRSVVGQGKKKKKAGASCIADENMELVGPDVRKRSGGLVCLLIKKPLSALSSVIKSEFGGKKMISASEQRLWFAGKPSIAETNYLVVCNSVRYAIPM